MYAAVHARVRYGFIKIRMKVVNFIKNIFIKNHFHQKPLSSKTTFIRTTFIRTTFIKNHFHQKPFSSKTIFIKNHFHKKPLSSKRLGLAERHSLLLSRVGTRVSQGEKHFEELRRSCCTKTELVRLRAQVAELQGRAETVNHEPRVPVEFSMWLADRQTDLQGSLEHGRPQSGCGIEFDADQRRATFRMTSFGLAEPPEKGGSQVAGQKKTQMGQKNRHSGQNT